ncbi:transcriptional regulator [Sphingobium sp. SJ10-10]|uniref:winged helix-turn-helix domain-containing protein n=1 Tax=unclassified Sphingobium TaxID=2611147 RepID=UPI0007704762|nr:MULTISPECIES: transcriptional regulator [Sphingomonadaceae]AMK24653.1 transcriptional regulator CadC [Sphingobium sp. TKS]MEC6698338.1 transcriptional regulator [Sphingobium sp. SJ10-10]
MAEITLNSCLNREMTPDQSAMEKPARILRFDAFQLDCDNRQLRKDGLPIALGSRYFDALALLVSRGGELVTKDVFMEQVWHGIPVTDEALTQCIRTLRRALGDDAANPRFIETVPKHGYRFVAEQSHQLPKSPRLQGSHVAGACTLAGLTSGAVAGLIYGLIAATGGGAQVLILAAMIGALGLLAGAGLGAGMATALTWRGRADGWMVAGTAIGGLAVGALGNLLGRESVGLLSGVSIANVTGPIEGVVLGTAAGVVAWAALVGSHWRIVTAVCLIAGAGAATLIFFSGGTLLVGSLQALAQGLSGTQLNLTNIGMVIGEAGLTRTAIGLTVGGESQIFILSIGVSLLVARDRTMKPGKETQADTY